jgi:AraC-like DNA-binding protein
MQVSILMVRALIGAVERAGGNRDRFLSVAGIEPRWIDEGTMRLALIDYLRVIDAALEVSEDPALGLHMGERARSFMFDVLGPLAEHAATMRESVDAMTRYSKLVAEGHEAELHEDGYGEDSVASIRFPSLRGDFPAVRLTAEFAMSALLQVVRMFAGEAAMPTQVHFAYETPAHAGEYQRIFGGVACFEKPNTQLQIPRAWLDKPQPYRSPELYAVLKTQADRSVDRLERDASLSQRVEQILATHSTAPTLEGVARELGISARSLRRRMLTEGLSFTDLATRSRMRMAKRMLERPGASIQETAYELGFASPAAFHRAFKRWTGMTPKQYQQSF